MAVVKAPVAKVYVKASSFHGNGNGNGRSRLIPLWPKLRVLSGLTLGLALLVSWFVATRIQVVQLEFDTSISDTGAVVSITGLPPRLKVIKGKDKDEVRQVKDVKKVKEVSPSSSTTDSADSIDALTFYQRHYDALSNTSDSQMLLWDAPRFLRDFWVQFPHYHIQTTMDETTNTTTTTAQLILEGGNEDGPTIPDPTKIPQLESTSQHRILRFSGLTALCDAAQFFYNYRHSASTKILPWRHVAIVGLHQDFGALSTSLPGYTFDDNHLLQQWLDRNQNCTLPFILDYINHPETLAVITSQYHMMDHPKAHSIPLGMQLKLTAQMAHNKLSARGRPERMMESTSNTSTGYHNERRQLLMVNFRLHKMRERVMNHLLSSNFTNSTNSTLQVKNTFEMGGPASTHQPRSKRKQLQLYFDELRTSKFVLSPGGYGLDCYRHWEALYMGTIPVIEHLKRQDGWVRTFDHLPVAWIDDYTNLTPQWLEDEYRRIISQSETYQWEKLTKQYWKQWVYSFLD